MLSAMLFLVVARAAALFANRLALRGQLSRTGDMMQRRGGGHHEIGESGIIMHFIARPGGAERV